MADYPFEGQLIADAVTFQRASNAQVYVYDAADMNNTTPLALKDSTGLPTANPLVSSADAFVKPIYAPSQDIKYVGDGLTIFVSSAKGMRDAAAASAAAAEVSKGQAETAKAEAAAAKAIAEEAAAAASGGGVAIDPADPDALIISTKNDGSVAIDPFDSDVLVITT